MTQVAKTYDFMPHGGKPFTWTASSMITDGDVVKVELSDGKTRFVPAAGIRYVQEGGKPDEKRYQGKPEIVDVVYRDGKKSKWYARDAAIKDGFLVATLLNGITRIVPVSGLKWFAIYPMEDK